jgi:UDP-N-acetylglucosamine diphosphorylase/glucosamine-1-phosphate N-acetyltransferase
MKQAIILAAGEGQRLRPFTANKPKVMLPIAGKPIVQYVIEALAQSGVRYIVLVAGYKRGQLLDYIGSGDRFGVEITYVTQERQLGTAHALAQASMFADSEFLVVPGDNLITAETLAPFVDVTPTAMLVKRVENPNRYGVVAVDGGMVRGIVEKPKEARSNVINTGIYAFTREIFDRIENQLDIPDVLNNTLARGKPVTAVETEGTWLDVVYPWDILSVNSAAIVRVPGRLGGTVEANVTGKGLVSIGKDTVIHANSYISGPVVIGDNCEIGPNVCILPATSIGSNVVISPFSHIKNSVISHDVNIGPGCIIEDSVIDSGCIIKGNFTAASGEADVKIGEVYYRANTGAMLGEGCLLGNNVVADPGVILGNGSQVQSLKLIRGNIPDRSIVL